MKALGERFYGRLNAYSQAIEASDPHSLAEALARNVMHMTPAQWPFSARWAQALNDLAIRQAGADWRTLKESAAWC